MQTLTCTTCGFDAAEFDRMDSAGTLGAIPRRWAWMLEGIPASLLAATPSGHSSVEELARSTVRAFGGEVSAEPAGVGCDWNALLENMTTLANEQQRHIFSDDGDLPMAVLHETNHTLTAAARSLHASGALIPQSFEGRGLVVGLFTSDGGVPKQPVDAVDVGARGLKGDRQADRRFHGRPSQALSLWSIEVIEALKAEGHPIAPGYAGENLTLSGIPWAPLRPGVRLSIGDLLAEITAYATPCAKNAGWFSDRDFRRIDHSRSPGRSRLYARVLRPGRVAHGARVVVEPES